MAGTHPNYGKADQRIELCLCFSPNDNRKSQTSNKLRSLKRTFFLISSQRVPCSIQHTDKVYLAMKAMLRAVKDHNDKSPDYKKIKTVACTGLGKIISIAGICSLPKLHINDRLFVEQANLVQ